MIGSETYGNQEIFLNNAINIPFRGEIWEVCLEPVVGAEIGKIRRVLVISSNSVGRLPLKLVAPITEWKQKFSGNIWHIKIEPDEQNKLTKISTVDVLQIRSLDYKRFIELKGKASPQIIEEAVTALAAIVEYQ